MSIDTRKDLLKLYHPSRQVPKAVATASEIVMDAMYWNGCPAGSYSKVFRRWKYQLPNAIMVYGDTTGNIYKFKGPLSTNPETETYVNNISDNWVRLGDCS